MIKKMIALDWLVMKVYQKWSLFLLFYMIGGCFIAPFAIIPMNAMLFFYLSTSPFFLEEKEDLNYLYLTLPIKRNDVVSGRYALSFVMFICGTLLGSVMIPIAQPFSLLSVFSTEDFSFMIDFKGYFTLLSISYLLYASLTLISFPCLFKLGYTKGKMWGYYLPALIFMLLITIALIAVIIDNGRLLFGKIIPYVSGNTILISTGVIVLATGILAVSYLISVRVYSKRDF